MGKLSFLSYTDGENVDYAGAIIDQSPRNQTLALDIQVWIWV